MINFIADLTSALYAAFCAFALAAQAMTPLFPYHVALALSLVVTVAGGVIGWSWRRSIWRLMGRK